MIEWIFFFKLKTTLNLAEYSMRSVESCSMKITRLSSMMEQIKRAQMLSVVFPTRFLFQTLFFFIPLIIRYQFHLYSGKSVGSFFMGYECVLLIALSLITSEFTKPQHPK